MRVDIPLPGRTFAKTIGCWNCRHRADHEKSLQHWQSTARPRENAKVAQSKLQLLDIPPGNKAQLDYTVKAIEAVVGHLDRFENSISGEIPDPILGQQGLCTHPGNEGSEYKAHNFLCDLWDAAEGASVARAGAAIDLLPEELKDIHGDGNE